MMAEFTGLIILLLLQGIISVCLALWPASVHTDFLSSDFFCVDSHYYYCLIIKSTTELYRITWTQNKIDTSFEYCQGLPEVCGNP